jgi:putative ABC transport system ATP-binding protein
MDAGHRAAYRARSLAIVFQTANLWPLLTAAENVRLGLSLAGIDADVAALLSAFGLAEAAGRRAAVLSGGEQQRVAIAAAAARGARLVLADEPTGELDEQSEAVVLDALQRLRDDFGTTVVIVTHSDQVARIADHVIEMRDGKVAA